MEPYNFEQDIKRKLEKRTIKPSENSWNKLANSLQSKEDKKNIKFLRIIGIAACIVGVLFVVSIFFNHKKESTEPTIVTSPIPQKEKSINNVEIEELVAEDDNFELIVNEKLEKTKQEKTIVKPLNNLKGNRKPVIARVESNIVKSDIISKNGLEKEVSAVSNEENQEIELVINQIEDLKTKHISVSTTDVDLLLKNAQKKLALERIYNENIKTVDAYKLLQDVEADIDKSTRTKILETLKLNYEHMKTVIAQRND